VHIKEKVFVGWLIGRKTRVLWLNGVLLGKWVMVTVEQYYR